MKIIVKTQAEKDALLKASRYIHDLREIDTDVPMVNSICHIYLTPEMVEVDSKALYFWDEKPPKKTRKSRKPIITSKPGEFTTYDTSNGHCGLCGRLSCRGGCFK